LAHLTAAEIAELKIEEFIFHVVHHGDEDPVLFDDVPLGTFAPFFIDRIKDTLEGNKFAFTAASQTKRKLTEWNVGKSEFVATSKDLARQFHRLGDKRMKKGMLIVIGLSTGARRLYSLIKYDSEKVVSFKAKDSKAILEAVVDNFTESPRALQKSALIDLNAQGAEVVVIDKMTRSSISDFYKEFLGVERTHNVTDMTLDLIQAVRKTVKGHADELPQEIVARVSPKIVEIAKKRLEFDIDQFFDDFFGIKGTEEIKETFRQELLSANLVGEVFAYDPDALPVASAMRYATDEGIRITIPASAVGSYEITPGEDETVIVIRTKILKEL
jgi:hypothetical protein